jgi:hypothetical protein
VRAGWAWGRWGRPLRDLEILEKVRAYAVVEDVVGSESIAGMITEYPIPLTLGPTHTPHKRGDAGQQK